MRVLMTWKRLRSKNVGWKAQFLLISDLWPMIFHSAMHIPFWFYFLCVTCITYNHKITIPLWDHVGACASWRDKMVKMVNIGRKYILGQSSENFQKIINQSIVEIPSLFCYLLLKGNCFCSWVSFLLFYKDGAKDYGLAKMHEIGKIGKNLTFDLNYFRAPTISHQLCTWNCFRPCRSFIWERLLNGILLAHWVKATWKWREGAVRPCLDSRNVTRQWNPNFSFSLL